MHPDSVSPANDDAPPEVHDLDLNITGMTCASCATRIERRLNRLEGVQATVNYATETARVRYDPRGIDAAGIVATVEATGYHAELPATVEATTVEASAVEAGGNGGTAETEPVDAQLLALQQRLIGTAALAIPVTLLSMVPALQFDNWQWMALTLAAPVATWGAWPFHRAALLNARHGTATMDTLISIGVTAAFLASVWNLFLGHAGMTGMRMAFEFTPARGTAEEHLYLEVAAAVTVFILAGRYLEHRAKRRAGAALAALLRLGARSARVLDESGAEREIPIEHLTPGDRFVVRPGERIATDGSVEEGASAVDTSLITGESVPVEVGPGDEVIGATVNAGGRLVVRATRVGSETALARMTRLVAEAQSGKAPVQRLADRVSAVFVPVVMVLAAATLVVWLIVGDDAGAAVAAAVAVLIIACPCALGLATPTAMLVGTGRGAQLGILIRGPEVLESTRRVDTIVLDKTGTLTTGTMSLVSLVTDGSVEERTALRLVGAVEHAAEHPIARAIAHAASAADPGRPRPTVSGFAATAGLGVVGIVDDLTTSDQRIEGLTVHAGRLGFVLEAGYTLGPELEAAAEAAQSEGRTVVFAGWNARVRALFVVADQPKPGAAEAIRRFRAQGLTPYLLTGDTAAAAAAVAAEVGIEDDRVIAGVLPADKVDVIRRLQAEGHVTAMVGDGVNDAAALAAADLGLAMGTGTDAAMEAADLTLVSGDLGAAADAIDLSRRTLTTIKGNLFWAFAYNVAALPLAAAGYLNPLIAGAAMAGSSVFVVTNSLRLRGFVPHRGGGSAAPVRSAG